MKHFMAAMKCAGLFCCVCLNWARALIVSGNGRKWRLWKDDGKNNLYHILSFHIYPESVKHVVTGLSAFDLLELEGWSVAKISKYDFSVCAFTVHLKAQISATIVFEINLLEMYFSLCYLWYVWILIYYFNCCKASSCVMMTRIYLCLELCPFLYEMCMKIFLHSQMELLQKASVQTCCGRPGNLFEMTHNAADYP